MTQIQIDPAFQAQLGGLTGPVEVRDAHGVTVGHFLPEAEYKRMLYASVKVSLSEEEIARREAEPESATLEEIWRELGQR